MAYMSISLGTDIEVSDLPSLLEAWRTYGGRSTIVRTFIMTGRLTDAQLRRLPKALHDMLLYCPEPERMAKVIPFPGPRPLEKE